MCAKMSLAELNLLVSCPLPTQGRALYGPIPVKTKTFGELSGPLVHTNFGGNSYGPIIGPYLFLGKFVWTNGPESSSKVSPYTGIGPWMALPSYWPVLQTGFGHHHAIGNDYHLNISRSIQCNRSFMTYVDSKRLYCRTPVK